MSATGCKPCHGRRPPERAYYSAESACCQCESRCRCAVVNVEESEQRKNIRKGGIRTGAGSIDRLLELGIADIFRALYDWQPGR